MWRVHRTTEWRYGFRRVGHRDGCCYGETNIDALPPRSLKFLLSASYNPTNASSGFGVLRIDPFANSPSNTTSAVLRFEFYSSDGAELLYTSPAILPRPVCWVLTVMPLGGRRQTMQPLACPDPPRLPLPVTIRRGAESRQPRQKTRCLSRLSHHCTPPDRQRVMSLQF